MDEDLPGGDRTSSMFTPPRTSEIVRNKILVDFHKTVSRDATLKYLRQVRDNPEEGYEMSSQLKRTRRHISAFLNMVQSRGESTMNMHISSPPDQFTDKMFGTIDKMVSLSGILNDLSSDTLREYMASPVPVVSYNDHRDYFRAPLPNERSCMMNNPASGHVSCFAKTLFGFCLRTGPRAEYTGGAGGLCIICERILIQNVYMRYKLKNMALPLQLNLYRYKVDAPGEYTSTYMHICDDKMYHGLTHTFPRFEQNVYTVVERIVKFCGEPRKVKFLIEKPRCFFRH